MLASNYCIEAVNFIEAHKLIHFNYISIEVALPLLASLFIDRLIDHLFWWCLSMCTWFAVNQPNQNQSCRTVSFIDLLSVLLKVLKYTIMSFKLFKLQKEITLASNNCIEAVNFIGAHKLIHFSYISI